MGPEKTGVIIIGGGITGLCTAYWLKKKGIDVTLLSKESDAGGTMKSVSDQGFLSETGPSTVLETTPLFKELVSDLKLKNEFVYSNAECRNRYILRNGNLNPVPRTAGSLLSTKLLSKKAFIRLIKEPFVKRTGEDESVADFFGHRFGNELLDYAVDPLVIGKYAGMPERLSVRHTFPALCDLEEKYGSILKGLLASRSERMRLTKRIKKFSFRSGMQTLPKAIAQSLGSSLVLNAKATGITDQAMTPAEPVNEPDARRYLVEYIKDGSARRIESDKVVLAIPAFDAAPIIRQLSAGTAHLLSAIYYSPVVSVFIGARREDFGRVPDGFGFLAPSKEKRQILGCIWQSSLFADRAPSGMIALNAFIGGSRHPELTDLSDDRTIEIIMTEFKSIMQFSGKPVYLRVTRWKKAIPQYETGYQRTLDAIMEFEESRPGIIFAGNYRGGVSADECVKNASEVARTLSERIFSTR